MNRLKFQALAALAMMALAASNAAAQNLLANAGFESPITSDGAPFVGFWEGFSGGAGSSASNSMIMPRTGAMHLELSIANTDNTFAGVFQDVEGLTPGQPVTFSLWHKTITSPLGLDPEMRIEWRKTGQSAEVGRTPNSIPVLTSDYAQFSLTAPVPTGADTARVVYAIQTFGPAPTNNGSIFVDDASVTVIPEPSTLALLALGGCVLVVLRRRRASRRRR